jgi:hypothetical protein
MNGKEKKVKNYDNQISLSHNKNYEDVRAPKEDEMKQQKSNNNHNLHKQLWIEREEQQKKVQMNILVSEVFGAVL